MNILTVVVFLAIGAVAGCGFIGSMATTGVGALALLYLVNLYDSTRKPSAIR